MYLDALNILLTKLDALAQIRMASPCVLCRADANRVLCMTPTACHLPQLLTICRRLGTILLSLQQVLSFCRSRSDADALGGLLWSRGCQLPQITRQRPRTTCESLCAEFLTHFFDPIESRH